MDPMQPGQEIPQQANNGTPNPTSLEDFIRQNAGVPVQQQPVQQQPAAAPVQPDPQLFPQNNVAATGIPPVQTQVVEKIVYKKQKVHGFFRTLTIIALVVVGFLMLSQALGIFTVSFGDLNLSLIYPIFIIFSSIVIWSYRGIFGKVFGLLLFLCVFGGFFITGVYTSLNPSNQTKFGSYVSFPTMGGYASKIYVDTLVSNLTLEGKPTNNLVEGNYGSERNLLVTTGVVASGHDYIILTENKNLNLLQNLYGNVSLGIKSTQPAYLYIRNILSTSKINLGNIELRNARIYSAGTVLDLTLGNQVKSGSLVDIQSALGDITLHLPKTLGVRLHYKDIVGKVQLVDFVEKTEGYFESTNIATARSVIDININVGVAKTTISWL